MLSRIDLESCSKTQTHENLQVFVSDCCLWCYVAWNKPFLRNAVGCWMIVKCGNCINVSSESILSSLAAQKRRRSAWGWGCRIPPCSWSAGAPVVVRPCPARWRSSAGPRPSGAPKLARQCPCRTAAETGRTCRAGGERAAVRGAKSKNGETKPLLK